MKCFFGVGADSEFSVPNTNMQVVVFSQRLDDLDASRETFGSILLTHGKMLGPHPDD